jgi:hypothetical protein
VEPSVAERPEQVPDRLAVVAPLVFEFVSETLP